MKSCVLFSGGMDSYLAWKLFAPEADLVFIDIGQPYLTKERNAAAAVTVDNSVGLVPLTATQIGAGPAPNGILLHRNALLILTAASYYSDIIMGVVADEINSDKSLEFFDAMEQVLNISHRGQYWNNGVGVEYSIHSPVRRSTKSELVAQYLEHGYATAPLLATVSCYDGEHIQCGKCPSCFKRWVALINNGLRQQFEHDPLEWARDNKILAKAQDGTYAPARADEINRAVAACKSI